MNLLWVDCPIVVCAWAFGEASYLSRFLCWMCVGMGWDGLQHPYFLINFTFVIWMIFWKGRAARLILSRDNIPFCEEKSHARVLLHVGGGGLCGGSNYLVFHPKSPTRHVEFPMGSWRYLSIFAPRYVCTSQGDVLAALANDPSIKCPIAIGNWSNTVEGESCFVGCLQCPLVIL